jgi:hypothetical protein
VKRDESGKVIGTLPMEMTMRYAKALIAFVREQDFEGKQLDSCLTDSTSDVVAEAFAAQLGNKADQISEVILRLMVSNERFLTALSQHLIALSGSPMTHQVRTQAASALLAKLGAVLTHALDTTAGAAIKASVVKFTAIAVTSPIAWKLTVSLVTTMGAALKPIILKLLASTAFKMAIMSKIKAIVVGSVLAAFMKLIGTKVAGLVGGSMMIIVLPLVLGWLAYEVVYFPEKLAEKVSDSVATDMAKDFHQTTQTIAESLVEGVLIQGAGLLARQLIADQAVFELVQVAVGEAGDAAAA